MFAPLAEPPPNHQRVISPLETPPNIEELSWLGDALGKVRDLSVLRDRLRTVDSRRLQVTARDSVVSRIDDDLARSNAALQEVRRSERYRTLINALAELHDSLVLTDDADHPALSVLAPFLVPPWREVSGAARAASTNDTSRRLHQLRIHLKRFQYATEVVAIVEGETLARVARAAEELQGRLGTAHDAAVAQAWLSDFMVREPQMRAVAAEMVTTQQRAERMAREGWRKDLKKLRRKWRRYRHHLD